MSLLVSTVTIEDRDGVDVPLTVDGYRWVNTFDGFTGLLTRQVTFPATGMHGQQNRTRYQDGKTGVITGTLHAAEGPDRTWSEYRAVAQVLADAVDTDRLMKWTLPDLQLQATVRLVDLTPALQVGPNVIRYQASFNLADPRAYSITETSTRLVNTGGGGLTLPVTFPFTFNASTGWIATLENAGNAPTPATFVFTGELTDPVVEMDDDESTALAISGTVASGNSLYVYTAPPARRVLLNDETNRIDLVNFAETRWFDIPPGVHTFRLTAATIGPDASVEIRARSAYE